VQVLTLAAFAAVLASVARAREYSPAVGNRFDTGVAAVPALPQDPSAERPAGLEISAAVAAAYDSNIFLSRNNAEGGMVYRISPAVAYKRGDAKEGAGGFMKFAWRPAAVIYGKAASGSRVDHDAALTAGWRGQAATVTYTGGLRKAGDATADTGRQTDRLESANEVRGAWLANEKVSVELAAGQSGMNYRNDGLYDSQNIYGEAAVRYAYSPKTAVGLAYRVGSLRVESAPNQETRRIAGTIDWQPRQKIRVNLLGGLERRKTANGPDVNPVAEGRVEWDAADGTTLYLSGYRREEASAFLAGQNYSTTGLTAGIAQRLGGNWTAKLEGGRESVGYKRVDGAGASGRNDIIWFLRPALEYKFSDNLDMSLFYRISADDSSSPDFGYDQSVTGAEFNYKF
jgi:hypothetical protein